MSLPSFSSRWLPVWWVQAEIASVSEQLGKYEEKFSQLAETEDRISETLQKSTRDFASRAAQAEKKILESTGKNQQQFLGRTQRLAKEIEQQGAAQKTAITVVDQKIAKLTDEAEKTEARVGRPRQCGRRRQIGGQREPGTTAEDDRRMNVGQRRPRRAKRLDRDQRHRA